MKKYHNDQLNFWFFTSDLAGTNIIRVTNYDLFLKSILFA